ncbi:hypothetical protein Q5M85_01695 [Paraclostridium bifermentans]|nr:hypothetical protein [Paraclostridium bifermentans]
MVNFIISNVFRITFIISIFASGVFIAFASDIGMAVYSNKDIGPIIRILAPVIPIMYLERIMDGIFKFFKQASCIVKNKFV